MLLKRCSKGDPQHHLQLKAAGEESPKQQVWLITSSENTTSFIFPKDYCPVVKSSAVNDDGSDGAYDDTPGLVHLVPDGRKGRQYPSGLLEHHCTLSLCSCAFVQAWHGRRVKRNTTVKSSNETGT
eukprot:1137663-Pelagomonas_calceolata.AAC.8